MYLIYHTHTNRELDTCFPNKRFSKTNAYIIIISHPTDVNNSLSFNLAIVLHKRNIMKDYNSSDRHRAGNCYCCAIKIKYSYSFNVDRTIFLPIFTFNSDFSVLFFYFYYCYLAYCHTR